MLLGGAVELTNGALRIPGGMLVRGNLRTSREEAFDAAEAAIKRMFGARMRRRQGSCVLQPPVLEFCDCTASSFHYRAQG